jgi:hypothetical protein
MHQTLQNEQFVLLGILHRSNFNCWPRRHVVQYHTSATISDTDHFFYETPKSESFQVYRAGIVCLHPNKCALHSTNQVPLRWPQVLSSSWQVTLTRTGHFDSDRSLCISCQCVVRVPLSNAYATCPPSPLVTKCQYMAVSVVLVAIHQHDID